MKYFNVNNRFKTVLETVLTMYGGKFLCLRENTLDYGVSNLSKLQSTKHKHIFIYLVRLMKAMELCNYTVLHSFEFACIVKSKSEDDQLPPVMNLFCFKEHVKPHLTELETALKFKGSKFNDSTTPSKAAEILWSQLQEFYTIRRDCNESYNKFKALDKKRADLADKLFLSGVTVSDGFGSAATGRVSSIVSVLNKNLRGNIKLQFQWWWRHKHFSCWFSGASKSC